MPNKKKSKRPPKTPKYRLHKASGQGYVEIDGHNIYLGKHELPETREKYHTLIAEWEANGRALPVPPDEITVVELLTRFWEHAKSYYRKPDGSNTGELGNHRTVTNGARIRYARKDLLVPMNSVGTHIGDKEVLCPLLSSTVSGRNLSPFAGRLRRRR